MVFTGLMLLGCGVPTHSTATPDSQGTSQERNSSAKLTFERMSPLVDAYRDIAKVLDLNETQSQRFDTLYKKHREIFESWYADEGKELSERQQAALSAARRRDLAALRELNANGGKQRVAELHAQQRQMQENFEKELIAAVPPEKLTQWKAHRIATLLLAFLEPLRLSPKQISEIHKQAPEVIQWVREANWQGYGTDRLEKRFEATIVTDQQREDFEKLKNANRLRMLRWNNL